MEPVFERQQFLSCLREEIGAGTQFDTEPWSVRMDWLYHTLRRSTPLRSLSQGALILWEVVATEELLSPEVEACLRAMSVEQVCEVLYFLQGVKASQFVASLHTRYAPIAVALHG